MSLIAAFGGALSALASAIGPALVATVDFVVTKLPVVLESASIIVNAISSVVTLIGENLNIAPPGENPEELGVKASQDGTRSIRPEETAQEYLDYLRNDVVLDKEHYDGLSAEEKLRCEVAGDVMLAKAIEEETGVEIPGEFLMAIPKLNMQYEAVMSLIEAFSDANISSLSKFTDYMANDMSETEAVRVGDAVEKAINETSPEMSPEDIQKEILAMKIDYNANPEGD